MEFNSSVENVDEVTRQVKISIPVETINREISTALDTLTKTINLKGFRPGKAPRPLVEKLHGERVRHDVSSRLISESINKVVEEQKIDVVGNPTVDIGQMESGKELQFTAKLSIFPKPEVSGYEKLQVSVARRPVTDKEVDEVIASVRESKATLKKNELRTSAKKGDVIEGTLAAEMTSGKKERPESLTVPLGEGKLPHELEEAIPGMEIGQSKTVDHQHDEKAEGPIEGDHVKSYVFTLSAISDKILPELTDEFVTTLDMFGAKTVLELRMKVREELEKKNKEEGRSDLQLAILDALLAKNEFQVPEVLIDDELRSMLVRAGISKDENLDAAMLQKFKAGMSDIAGRRVKSAIIIDRIGEAEKIKAEEADIQKTLGELAVRHNSTIEAVRGYFLTRERVVGFVMEITRNKVLEFLEQRTEVTYTEPKEEDQTKVAAGA